MNVLFALTNYFCKNPLISAYENKCYRSDHKFFPPTGSVSFWTSITGAVKLLDDVEDVKSDKINLTSLFYDNENKAQRIACSKVNTLSDAICLTFSVILILELFTMMVLHQLSTDITSTLVRKLKKRSYILNRSY